MTKQIQQALQAIQTGDVAAISALLEEFPTLSRQQTEQGISLLMMSAYYRNPAIVQILRETKTELDLHEAAAVGEQKELNRHLASPGLEIDAFAADGFSALGLACFFGHISSVQRLIEAGADVNLAANNSFKVRPLHSAVASKHVEIARLLLTHGANPNVQQQNNVSPLHSAAHNGQLDMVQLLLTHGANSEMKTVDGKTPLDMAKEAGHEAVIRMLE
ncbi:MAG: ankyrin repeat domain-containing protein [Bacteroidota bacterium]